MKIAEKLLRYAEKNPDGFTVYISNNRIYPVKGTKQKRFVVSTTNNDTIEKIKASFQKGYKGYAGGWYDKKSGKYYIDKNIVIGDKQKATNIARKHKQKAIFDLLDFKEIRMQKFRSPVIKKDGKWYNTITKRYVSRTTAQRYNSYFKRNPEGTLARAYGNYRYDPDRPYDEQGRKLRKLGTKDTQVIKTRTRKGKVVGYAPFQDEFVSDEILQKLGKLDYDICNHQVQVKLFRQTRDKNRVYHVFKWIINMEFRISDNLEVWLSYTGIPTADCILREVSKVVKKFPLGQLMNLYGHIDAKFVSNIDYYPVSKTFGFYIPDKGGITAIGNELADLFNGYISKLSTSSYHLFYILSITFFVYSSKNEFNKILSEYRSGVLGV